MENFTIFMYQLSVYKKDATKSLTYFDIYLPSIFLHIHKLQYHWNHYSGRYVGKGLVRMDLSLEEVTKVIHLKSES